MSACAGVRGVVSGVMGVMGVIDVVDGAGEMSPDRNPFVKLVRKDVGAEELVPFNLEGGMMMYFGGAKSTIVHTMISTK